MYRYSITLSENGLPWWFRQSRIYLQCGRPGSIPRLRRSPGEGNGNPHQYSCLENSMDRGAWWAVVHGVTRSWTWLNHTNTHTNIKINKILYIYIYTHFHLYLFVYLLIIGEQNLPSQSVSLLCRLFGTKNNQGPKDSERNSDLSLICLKESRQRTCSRKGTIVIDNYSRNCVCYTGRVQVKSAKIPHCVSWSLQDSENICSPNTCFSVFMCITFLPAKIPNPQRPLLSLSENGI